MRRFVFVLTLALLAACGKKKDAGPSPTPTPSVPKADPLRIERLEPETGSVFDRPFVLVTFRTNRPARASIVAESLDGKASIRKEGPEATEHRIELSDLDPGSEYRLRVEAADAKENASAEERRFSVRRVQGLVFLEHDLQLEVDRADDQRAEIRIRNTDNRDQAVRIVESDVPNDLVVGALGPGSEDEAAATRLEPGEVRSFRLMIHASAAARGEHEFRLRLRDLTLPDRETWHDEARVRVKIRFPKFDLKIVPLAAERNPSSLVVPVEIRNDGELVSDLTVELDDRLAGRVSLAPQYTLFSLQAGASVRFLAIPVLDPGFSKLEGNLIVRGAGEERRVPIRFEAPEGKSAFLAWGGTLDDDHVCSSACSNTGHVPASKPTVRGGEGTNAPTGGNSSGPGFHRITRPTILRYLPDLARESVVTPAIARRGAFEYRCWHEATAAGARIRASIEPFPSRTVDLTTGDARDEWPAIAVTEDGRALVVWERHYPDSTVEILAAEWDGRSDGPGAAQPLSKRAQDLHNPILVSGAGRRIALWQDGASVEFRVTLDDGKIWSEPRRIDSGETMAWQQMAITPSGELVVVYASGRIRARTSSDGGETWSPPVDLSTAGDVGEPTLAVARSGAVMAVWRDEAGLSGSRTDGKAWTPAARLVSRAAELPHLAADSAGKIRLTYFVEDRNCLRRSAIELDPQLRVLRTVPDPREDQIRAILGRFAISLGDATGTIASFREEPVEDSFTTPCVVRDARGTRFVWHSGRGGNARVMFAMIGSDLRFAVRPIAINPPGTAGGRPFATLTRDGVAVAYPTKDGKIAVQRSRDGETWTDPVLFGASADLPTLASAADGRLALAWIEGSKLHLSVDGRESTVSESVRPHRASIAFDSTGALRIAFADASGAIRLDADTVFDSGVRPSLAISGDAVVVACETGGGIAVRRANEPVEMLPAREGMVLPSVLNGRVAFWAPTAISEGTILAPFVSVRSASGWAPPLRLFSLEPNVERFFLTVMFGMKHERRVYRPHDTHIYYNGALIASLTNRIPEGTYLFPLDPDLMRLVPFGTSIDDFDVRVEGMNRAHYILALSFRVVVRYRFHQRYLFASSQEEADAEIRKVESDRNHDRPDVGVFANELKPLPDTFDPGRKIRLDAYVFNLGIARASDVRVQAYAERPMLVDGRYQGRTLPAQDGLGDLDPFEGAVVPIEFDFPANLTRAFVAAETASDDFRDNDVHAATFTVPPEESPLATLRREEPAANVKLTIRVGSRTAAADEVDVEFFPAGNRLRAVLTGDGGGAYRIRPFLYDVRIRARDAILPVEAWIEGLRVEEGKIAEAEVVLPLAAVALSGSPGDGTLRVQLPGLRGAAVGLRLKSGEAKTVRLPAGRYDFRIDLDLGAIGTDWSANGLELAAGAIVPVEPKFRVGTLRIRNFTDSRAENPFLLYVSIVPKADPDRPVLSQMFKGGALSVAEGEYEVTVSHPNPPGSPENQEIKRSVKIEADREVDFPIDLPLATLRVQVRSDLGNIVQVYGQLYRSGDYRRPAYYVNLDKPAIVVQGKYDLCVFVGRALTWVYAIDLSTDRSVPVSLRHGRMQFDFRGAFDHVRVLTLCRETEREGLVTTAMLLSEYVVRADLPRITYEPGRYDVLVRATGYGDESEVWRRNVEIQAGWGADVSAQFALGTIVIEPSDTRVQGLRVEIFLHPAGDNVTRIVHAAKQAPLLFGEPVAVSPGAYDVHVRYPDLGPDFDQVISRVLVDANANRRVVVPVSSGALLVKVRQEGGWDFAKAGVVLDRVGGSTGRSRSDRILRTPAGGIPLREGFYDVTPALSGILVDSARRSNVEVVAGRLAESAFSLSAGEVVVRTKPLDAGVWLVPESAGLSGAAILEFARAEWRGVVPAGTYRVVVFSGTVARTAKLVVEPNRENIATIEAAIASVVLSARRADGEILIPEWEILPAVASGTFTGPNLVPPGTYDIRFKLETGEERVRRGVVIAAGAPVVVEEEFPAKTLIVVSKDAGANAFGSGLWIGVFSGAAPVGWFRMGTGAALAKGTYDLLVAADRDARDGVWRRGVAVGDAPVRIELEMDMGFLLAESWPALQDAEGLSASRIEVFRGTERVYQARAGKALAVPQGTYDVVLKHDGAYGKFEERWSGVTVRPGRTTARLADWSRAFGYASVTYRYSEYFGSSTSVTVLRDGVAIGKYADVRRIPLPAGRYTFVSEDRRIGEFEIYRGRVRAIDVPAAGGRIVSGFEGRARLTPLDADRTIAELRGGRHVDVREGSYLVRFDSGETRRVDVRGSEIVIVGGK